MPARVKHLSSLSVTPNPIIEKLTTPCFCPYTQTTPGLQIISLVWTTWNKNLLFDTSQTIEILGLVCYGSEALNSDNESRDKVWKSEVKSRLFLRSYKEQYECLVFQSQVISFWAIQGHRGKDGFGGKRKLGN